MAVWSSAPITRSLVSKTVPRDVVFVPERLLIPLLVYVVSLSSEASLTSRTQSPNAHFVFSGPCPVILGLFAPRGVCLRLSLGIFHLGYMEFPGCTSCAVLGWTWVACCHPKRKLEPLIHIPALTELLCGWAEKKRLLYDRAVCPNPARVVRCGGGVGEGLG